MVCLLIEPKTFATTLRQRRNIYENAFKLNRRVSFFKTASHDEGGNEWTSEKPWRNSTKPSYPEKAHSTGPHRDAGGGINVSSHRARWRKKGISGAGYACRHCFSPSNVLFGNSAGSPRNHCSRLVGNWLLDETALLSHKSSVTIQFDSLYSTEMCLVTLLWHYWSWSLAR